MTNTNESPAPLHELFMDPPHHRDINAPCFACGARWTEAHGTNYMVHQDDCPFGAPDHFEDHGPDDILESDAPSGR